MAFPNGRIIRLLGEGTIPTGQVSQLIGVPLCQCQSSSPMINRNVCLSMPYQAGQSIAQIAIYSTCSGFAAQIGRAHTTVVVRIIVVVASRQASAEPFLKISESIEFRVIIYHICFVELRKKSYF